MPAGTLVASLFGVLSLDDTSFNRGMDSAEGRMTSAGTKLEGFAGGITNVIGGVGKAAAIGATAIVGATTAIGTGMFELAREAAPIQGIANAFDGIATASGKSSDEVLKALKDSSKGMIKNTDLMMSYNSAAQLVSTEFANQLPDAMQYLTKVAAATGQDMGFMMDSLVKGVGRASPMILDNLGIQVNLTEATEEYAKSIGKNADELTKSEVQTAFMNKTLEALKANTASMPDITDNASTKWGQFQTRLANFKDDIGVKLLPFFEVVLDLLMQMADAALPVLMPLIEGLANGFTSLIGGLGGVGGVIENTVMPVLRQLATWFINDALPAIVGFVTGTVIPAVQRFIDIVASIWNMVSPVLSSLFDWFVNTGLPLVVGFIRDSMIPYIEKLIAGIMVIWEKVQPGLQSLFDWFVTTGLPAITGFIENTAMPIISEIIRIIGDIWTTVAPALGDLAAWFLEDALPSIVNFIETTVVPAIDSIISILSTIWTVASPFLNDFKTGIENIFNWVKNNVIQPLVNTVQGLLNKIAELKNALTGGLGAYGGAASNAATAAGLVSSGQVTAGDFFGALGRAISSEFGRAAGGPVYGGQPYIVGEQGPELFTPAGSGTITNAQDTAMMGGFSITGGVHIYANSEAEGYAAMDGVLARARAKGY